MSLLTRPLIVSLEPKFFDFAIEVYVLYVTLVNVKCYHWTYLVLSYVFHLPSDYILIGHTDSESNLILKEIVHQTHLVINVERQ